MARKTVSVSLSKHQLEELIVQARNAKIVQSAIMAACKSNGVSPNEATRNRNLFLGLLLMRLRSALKRCK
jgi:hypothetical protein